MKMGYEIGATRVLFISKRKRVFLAKGLWLKKESQVSMKTPCWKKENSRLEKS